MMKNTLLEAMIKDLEKEITQNEASFEITNNQIQRLIDRRNKLGNEISNKQHVLSLLQPEDRDPCEYPDKED